MTSIVDRGNSNVVYIRPLQPEEYSFPGIDSTCMYMACSEEGNAMAAFEYIDDAFEIMLEDGYDPEYVH